MPVLEEYAAANQSNTSNCVKIMGRRMIGTQSSDLETANKKIQEEWFSNIHHKKSTMMKQTKYEINNC